MGIVLKSKSSLKPILIEERITNNNKKILVITLDKTFNQLIANTNFLDKYI